jgi:hypothetical protein
MLISRVRLTARPVTALNLGAFVWVVVVYLLPTLALSLKVLLVADHIVLPGS